MTTDLKRALAFKQFNMEEYFVWKDIAYEGEFIDVQEQFSEQDIETKEYGFDEFIKSNCVEIEEADQFYGRYLICTEEEADDRMEECLQDYIDDCIIPELPKHLQQYFDDEKWKEDKRIEGAGNFLAGYDGTEYEEIVEGEIFYIYRTN